MKYYELTCTAYLKRDIEFKSSYETISRYISFAMAQVDRFLELHNSNKFKYYTFSSFTPIEQSKIYLAKSSYEFTIRSLDKNLIEVLSLKLRENINNPNFLVVDTKYRVLKYRFISELYSLTPVVVTVENNLFWTIQKDGDIVKLHKQLHSNLEKKYQAFFKERLNASQNFIHQLELKNRVPQNIELTKNGKSFRFFGNKLKVIPHEDEISQKLAFVALACGLGEKNAFGAGFCTAK